MTEYLVTLLIFAGTLTIINSAPQTTNFHDNPVFSPQDVETNMIVQRKTSAVSEVTTIQGQNDLEFPPGFVDTDSSNETNREEMYVLAWTMCDSYRRVATTLKKKLLTSAGFRKNNAVNIEDDRMEVLFLRFQLANNPMEPSYHWTCLELFRRYPDMRRQIQEKDVPLLLSDEYDQ